MTTKLSRVLPAALLIATLGASAAEPDGSRRPMEGQRAPGMQGMQGMQGMHGMMDMMQNCPMMAGQGGSMMRGHGAHMGMMPRLPPGNEKLQLQMHGEIMQKVGEILMKYAAQAK
jgi:hypothetical protein